MNIRPLVLVIDDDLATRRILRSFLASQGYDYEETASAGALSFQSILRPDIIIMDIAMPTGNGHDLIKQLRQNSPTPILVISSLKKELDIVRSLDAGADDYLIKPFGLAELGARIRVALRKKDTVTPLSPLVFGSLRIDAAARRIFLEDKEIHLTALEYKLLYVMALHAGKVLTTAFLLKEVWGYAGANQKHYVRILAAALRRKLESDQPGHQFIYTKTGVGYQFFN